MFRSKVTGKKYARQLIPDHWFIMYGPAPRSTRLMLRLGPSVNTSPHDTSPTSRSCWTDANTISRSRTTFGSLTVVSGPSSWANTLLASSTRSWEINQRGDSGSMGRTRRMATRKTPWKAMGHLQAKDVFSSWLLARPMNVLSGWPKAIKALWMTSIAYDSLANRVSDIVGRRAYTAVVTLETLCLPDWYVDSVDAISNTSDDARKDHLDSFDGRGLENGSNHHDPATPFDTAFATKAVGSHEGEDCSEETSNVVDSSNDTFHVSIRIIEFRSERGQADDGPQDTLIISEEL